MEVMRKISKRIRYILILFVIIICGVVLFYKDKEIDDIFPFLDKGVGHWEKTSKMVIPRDSTASAVLLADGNVLISGGYGNKQYQNTAEIYYPKENVFRLTGNLNHRRAGHSSFLLKDGRVVILGGISTNKERYTNDVEMYFPKDHKFVITDTLPEKIEHSALLDNDYIVSQKTIYNPITKNYKKIEVNYARGTAPVQVDKSTYLINGIVLNDYPYGKLNNTIIPEDDCGFIYTNIAEKYNFNQDSYIITGKSTTPKTASGLIVLPDRKILIVGGRIFKKSGSGSANGVLDYNVYKHNILPLYKSDFKKTYWWWKDCDQNLEVYDTNSNVSKIIGQKLKYAFGNHSNSDLILLQNRYVFVANGLGRRAELIDTQTWVNYPVKKMPKPILTSSIPIKIDENTILFIGTHIYKNLPYGYIFRLDNIKE